MSKSSYTHAEVVEIVRNTLDFVEENGVPKGDRARTVEYIINDTFDPDGYWRTGQ